MVRIEKPKSRVKGRVIHAGQASGKAVRWTGKDTEIRGQIAVLDNLLPEPVVLLLVQGPAGVIAIHGGLTSHGAALLREGRVPAVSQVQFPNEWYGMQITLNATNGTVELRNGEE